MSDITHTHEYKIELNEGLTKRQGGLIGLGDDAADVFKLIVKKAGSTPADLESATGYFVRPDGATVLIEGSVSSGTVTVLLPEECYVYAGAYQLTIKVETTAGSGATASAVILEGRILMTRTNATVDPGSIWNVNDLWNAIELKVDEPAAEGTSGQALLTDGNGGRYWGSAASAQAVGAVIVDGVTYSLRTGTEGAAGYLTFVEEE